MRSLNDILNTTPYITDPQFFENKVPTFIYSNLKRAFVIRSYQKEAFGRFVYYWNEYDRPKGVPTQLLYHMATGSGKTLIMAGLIIYLYDRGYRNFLFFVNSTNIIDKTRDNFLNTLSSKYVFSETISIREKQIKIKEAETFQTGNQDDINIVFSTIQGLHSGLSSPRENSMTYNDFEDTKIVLISDEAHHINAETKKRADLSIEEKDEIVSWEGTVSRIFNANAENILLEFTATADLSVPEINRKYSNKLIFDYSLKQFRKDGYSKEVKVIQADLPPFERALQAVILSQYRRKIFEKYKKLIKPVILFKSKTIKESETFFEEFITRIKDLRVSDLQKIKSFESDSVIKEAFNYLDTNNISFDNFIAELREDFSEDKLLSVNSKDESEQKQLAVNSLEDESNEYRAIFAVDKLNEGWDVLNLFDIVRLYDTKDSKNGKPGKTTTAEAQLIGRGARYCPFQITPGQALFERKFDDDVANELRVCEELYYHSAYNPQYIQELNTALEDIGIKAQYNEEPHISEKKIPDTPYYKPNSILPNEQKKYSQERSLKSKLVWQTYKVDLKTGYSTSGSVFGKTDINLTKAEVRQYKLLDLGDHIIRKAINKLEFYQFSNLKNVFPHLDSVSEFINSKQYLGDIELTISGRPEQLNNLSPEEKLEVSLNILENISIVLINEKIKLLNKRRNFL